MTRDSAVAKLADGIQADLAASNTLLDLLERQFDAALRHRSAQLAELAEQLMPALEAMDQRRLQRVALVRALLGPDGDMAQLIASLAAPVRAAFAADWQALEQRVVECKRLNARNSALLTEQFSIMQRVLNGEEEIYAPR
ncbi:flagellar export chaperone FlgN [Massilia sp. GCM10020059]|uniref:Flagellar protein FlgN n=1 Tax=Massilia agrisoli TaxID=2892444 RepID=A0ABS8IQ00_9BURK|nr:flagellar export chaperone FlgN [Massilia agrisoli]MCC6069933.1 flagellar protein FlgN [Massilia agrisoli]